VKPSNPLTPIFAKYAGREVDTSNPANDPTLTALSADLEKAGFHLRVWTPGSVGTMDIRMDRVNIHFDKKGLCKMSNHYNIG
jgi:hypothetical protein